MESDRSAVWNGAPTVPGGVTTDGHDYLFVCDQYNWCIQMFHTAGVYMQPVLRCKEHGMSKPILIRWCKGLSSLVVVHQG